MKVVTARISQFLRLICVQIVYNSNSGLGDFMRINHEKRHNRRIGRDPSIVCDESCNALKLSSMMPRDISCGFYAPSRALSSITREFQSCHHITDRYDTVNHTHIRLYFPLSRGLFCTENRVFSAGPNT